MPSVSPLQLSCSPIESLRDSCSRDVSIDLWRYRWLGMAVRLCHATEHMIGGWLSPHEAQFLTDLTASLPNRSLAVELGSFMGKSSRYLTIATLFSQSRLVCIDPFDSSGKGEPTDDIVKLYQRYAVHGGTLPIFLRSLETLLTDQETEHVTITKALSKDAAKKWKEGPIDFLFIDGNHEECYLDFQCWEPHMADHGLIALHDTLCRGGYGQNGPDNTGFYMQHKHGWKAFGLADSLAAFTREPEFWATRLEATVSANPDRPERKPIYPKDDPNRGGDPAPADSGVGDAKSQPDR